jgi:uncharacterized protein YndB with AHSA1/START domain
MTNQSHQPNDDAARTHFAQVEAEVPGTPEEVWEAIATGPGISAWFMPTEIEGREGGVVYQDMGGGTMEPAGVITAWEPSKRAAIEQEWPTSAPGVSGRLATEYLVEARSGGSCVVRIVSSGFGGDDDWDEQFESMQEGWTMFLRNLRLYLTHFAGQHCSSVSVSGSAQAPHDHAFRSLLAGLGLGDAAEGAQVSATAPGAPALSGTVEWVWLSTVHGVLQVSTKEPAPGYALVLVNVWQGVVHAHVVLYLFGDDAPAVAEREAPKWRSWMDEHFPSQAESAA